MKALLPILIAVVISLAAGIVIGRKSTPDLTQEGNSEKATSTKAWRSTQRSPNHSSSEKTDTFRKKMTRLEREGVKMTDVSMTGDWTAYSFAIWKITQTMSAREVQDALAELKDMDLSQRAASTIKNNLLKQWAKLDGQAATEYGLADRSGRWAGQSWNITSNAWISHDSYAAEAWYQSHKKHLSFNQQNHFEILLLRSIAEKDFPQALEKVKNSSLLQRESRLNTLINVAAGDEDKLRDLTDYVSSLESEKMKKSLARSIARQLAYQSPEKAIQFIESWTSEDKDGLIRTVAYNWMQKEPEKSLAWQLEQHADSDEVTAKIASLFSQWPLTHPTQASKWIDDHPELDGDMLRKRSISRIVWNNDFSTATQWAGKIEDDGKRTSSYKTIYSRWKGIDPEGAGKWLGNLPEEDQSAVLGSKN